MRRLTALALAAVLLLAVVAPALAASMGEFSPGDDPPRSIQGTSHGCANAAAQTCSLAEGQMNPAGTNGQGQGYNPPSASDNK